MIIVVLKEIYLQVDYDVLNEVNDHLNDEITNDIILIIGIVQQNQLMMLNLVLLMDVLKLKQLRIET